MKRYLISLILAYVMASPAHAVRYRIDVVGTLIVPTSPNPIPGFDFGNGIGAGTAIGSWTVDFANATPSDLPPIGGEGQARIYRGAVSNGSLTVFGPSSFAFTQNATSAGGFYVINDAKPPSTLPNARLDQVSIADGASFGPGTVNPTYTLQNGLAPDIYIRSINFGRSAVNTVGNPTMIDSVSIPDFAALFAAPPGGAAGNKFFGFTLAHGPIGLGGPGAVPFQNFSVGINYTTITSLAVPEPASWGMLIGGFLGVGSVARSRKARIVRTA